MRRQILSLTLLCSAPIAAQADVAAARLDAAAAATAAKDLETAVTALCEARLAIDAVPAGEARNSLEARAGEVEKAAGARIGERLQFCRTVVAGLEPAVRELVDARCPTLGRHLVGHMPVVTVARHAAWLTEVETGLDAGARDRDKQLIAAFTLAIALDGGHARAGVLSLLEKFPQVRAWLTRKRELAPAAMAQAIACQALKWHESSRLFALTAIDLGAGGADRQRCSDIVAACKASLVEVRYRTLAKVHMDAFRRNCRKYGDNLTWEFEGSEWRTPWRGAPSLVIANDAFAGDFTLEVDVQLRDVGSRFQVVVARIEGPGGQDACAVEVELLSARQSAQLRLLHLQGSTSRTLSERKVFVDSWDFHTVTAAVQGTRVTATVAGESVAADLPLPRGPDVATRFGFAVPEQTGRRDGKRRAGDDVIGIRNLVVRRGGG